MCVCVMGVVGRYYEDRMTESGAEGRRWAEAAAGDVYSGRGTRACPVHLQHWVEWPCHQGTVLSQCGAVSQVQCQP